MTRLLILFIFTTNFLFGQENLVEKSTFDKFISSDLSSVQTIEELSKGINKLTINKKEQLQLLLLWTEQNMNADSIRFFQEGNPLTTAESIKKRIGLCDEFSNILCDFCKTIDIPCFRIVGYVKSVNFVPGDNFTECNHSWNAVYIDSTWMLCDMFWATTSLKTHNLSSPRFVKKLNPEYFLATPKAFIIDHLPSDPIFQFDNYPITINTFSKFSESEVLTIERLPFLNYSDSIKLLSKLKKNDYSLRIAQHSYLYNKYNPNFIISEYYNYGVAIINNRGSTKTDMLKAKNYFNSALSLMSQSDKQDIKSLIESCKQGLNIINRKINAP